MGIGLAFWLNIDSETSTAWMVLHPLLFLHFLLQFVPFGCYVIAMYFECPLELISCKSGMWWPIHWCYFAILFLVLPVMGGAPWQNQAVVPHLGMKGSYCARSWLYALSLIHCCDQYLDSMGAAIALMCGWRLAWLMAALIPIGMLLQALITAVVAPSNRTELALVTLFGFTPQSSLLRILHHEEVETNNRENNNEAAGEESEPTVLSPLKGHVEDVKASASFVAAQGIARFVTENLPQAALSIMFAQEMKPSLTVYCSTATSLFMALNAFSQGISYFSLAEEQRGDLQHAKRQLMAA